MKKRFALAMLSISSIMFAAEVTTVLDTKVFTKSIYPTRMMANIGVNAPVKTFSNAKEEMEIINKTIKSYQETCQVDSAQIQPKFSYENKKQKQDGYVVNVAVSCEFTDVSEYDKVLNAIYQKSKEFSLQISASPINWSVSDTESQQVVDDLKAKAISYGLNRAKTLSKQLSLTCQTKTIKFQAPDDRVRPMPMMAKVNTQVADTLVPTEPLDLKEQKVRLFTEYSWGCGF
ncbi:MAG: hypothetical protein RL154_1316 [Pseudomonadota bacterium]